MKAGLLVWPAMFVTALSVASESIDAQSSLDSLSREVAQRTASYVDRRVAIAEGYRRVGTDFPGMGEHWLHPRTLLQGTVDASHPTLLTYAVIDGAPKLLGVGFLLTTHSDSARVDAPGWPNAWHEHSGLLTDESGARVGTTKSLSSSTRVWVLHIWTQLRNPNGNYTPDNWALPFARLGIRAPPNIDADAARALSLAVGGDSFLLDILSYSGLRDSATAVAVDAALDTARASAERVAAGARTAAVVSPADVAALQGIWRSLADSLRGVLGATVDILLARPHAAHNEPPSSR